MKYENVIPGVFIARPNRFIAYVNIDGEEQVCHVKNTGRCRELLIPGTEVFVQRASNPNRRTKYDLIAVRNGERIVNIDSQAPNRIAAELIPTLYPDAVSIRPEAVYGDSRLDFRVDFQDHRRYIEVKGVTLENDGVAMFPDAPTERGVKHLRELIKCVEEGNSAAVLFIIQMTGVRYMTPNDVTHPEFGAVLREAQEKGVDILAFDCDATPEMLTPKNSVTVNL
jgi:sugar fermentation stimulation protein A